MEIYEKETIDLIKEKVPEFKKYSDEFVEELYSRYSKEFSSDWLACRERTPLLFKEWATKTPIQHLTKEMRFEEAISEEAIKDIGKLLADQHIEQRDRMKSLFSNVPPDFDKEFDKNFFNILA